MKYWKFFRNSTLGLVLILFLFGCNTSQIIILSNLTQDDANNVVLTLGEQNITAQRIINKDGSYAISIPQDKQITALEILHNDGKPNQNFSNMGEIFKKDSFISSPLEEQARFIYALEQQISSQISQIDGVVSVSTQVSLPPANDSLWQNQTLNSSASVLVKYKENSHLQIYNNRIKQLVANAVPGLTLEHVELIMISIKDQNN